MMCRFLSVLGLEDGTILKGVDSDSHSTIIAENNVAIGSRKYIRIEFVPPTGHGHDFSNVTAAALQDTKKWKMYIDEHPAPKWVTPTLRKSWKAACAKAISDMYITKYAAVLAFGRFILGPGANVQNVQFCRLRTAGTSAGPAVSVGYITNSSIAELSHCSVVSIGENTTVHTMQACSVKDVWGNAQVGTVDKSSTIGRLSQYATVLSLFGKVISLQDYAKVIRVETGGAVGSNTSVYPSAPTSSGLKKASTMTPTEVGTELRALAARAKDLTAVLA